MYNSCFKNTDGPDSLPDPSLPLAHQLEFALSKISAHVRTIANMTATCKRLDEVCFSLPVHTLLLSLDAKAVVFNLYSTHSEVEREGGRTDQSREEHRVQGQSYQ